MPIYPLDGGRLLNIFVNYFIPYKKGNRIVIFISMIIVLFMIFSYKNLNFIMMGILLLSELFLYFKRQDFLYNRMLLERYINDFKFKRLKIIHSKDNMYKDCRHVIFYKNKYITEKSYLNKRFKVEK
jgi:stage IV sporulation protein FB